ncbi:PREDICTED: methylmalonate-semialdehyde dehydrogenase [acylating], mitochondrial-like isoform X1 [Ipomoea nil]|uniref:methylmalonate-semialdehyde dehydrogenase [acylating], mitochondrial-like isoform X1 n=1 Tax=Ipomoea nil TaxID=35883 RepID=UPI000900DCB6|nr:PREDICTED: methylmalonate-semialdehyde dehydrogenase [acylating], mitochondrial-like isoform X1 [Ipomoea nil]
MASYMESIGTPQMLPPPPGSFIDREELIQHVGEYALSQGYVVTIKQSKKDKVVVLGCDRGGVYRNRRKHADETSCEHPRKRKTGSRLTNCPFELQGKKVDGLWVLTVKNASHNHEALKDISEHPSARCFSEKEVLLIKEMSEAGLKPRQILKRLRQSNPELLSTPKHVYNVKAKLRQGNLTVRRLKTLKPSSEETQPSTSEPSWRKNYPLHRRKCKMLGIHLNIRCPNFIGGRFLDSQSSVSLDVINPATQQVVSQVPLTTDDEFKAAVFAAKRAFRLWRNTSVTLRQRIMFKFQELIRRDIDKLAFNITAEHGKTLKDAYNEVQRGLEMVDHVCGIARIQMGDFFPNISNGVDSYSIREPLGICAGICSFNFPSMIPLWMFPFAISCGNTFILKPSEKSPGACMILAELALEAGLPNGVLNIVHGTNDIVNSICGDDDIKVVSIFGSDASGMHAHGRCPSKGKYVQANIGAKNYAIVMPDANMDATLNALVEAGFGAAGQRCMTINTVVFVGDSSSWEDKLVERAKVLKVNAGTEPGANLGPVISNQAKEWISRTIQAGIDSGARLVLDGREIAVSKYEMGNFMGPTILADIKVDMEFHKEEILGPVLFCMQAGSLDEAICIVNCSKLCIGASIFTSSGAAARKFRTEIESRQVGINAVLPAPLPFFLLTDSRASFTGDLSVNGKDILNFYTQTKTVTQQWKDFPTSEGTFMASTSNDPLARDRDLSNSNGVSLALQSKDFQCSDVESLGEHSRDVTNSSGISPAMAVSEGSSH